MAFARLLTYPRYITVPELPPFDVGAHLLRQFKHEMGSIGHIGKGAERLIRGYVEPEPVTTKTTLCIRMLTKHSLDGPIVAALGGDDSAVTTTWGQIYQLIEWQDLRGNGFLINNGFSNIFYTLNPVDGKLWAISCALRLHQPLDGWYIDASPAAHCNKERWRGCRSPGYQVVGPQIS